ATSASRRAEASATSADARLLGAEALRAGDVDTALLLGVAGWQLEASSDTRANLLAALDRAPALLRTERVARTTSLAVSEAGGRLVTQAPERALELRSLDTLALVSERPELRGPAVVASADGVVVAVSVMSELLGPGRPHGAVVLLDADGSVAAAQPGGMPERRYVQQDLTLTPDGRWLAATFLDRAGGAPLVGLWDLDRPATPVALLDLGPQSGDPTPSADGTTLYSVGEGRLRVTDVGTGRARRVLTGADLGAGELGGSVALSADGAQIAVAADRQVVLVATATNARLAVLPTPGDPGGVSFSGSGSRLASAGEALLVWDVPSDAPPTELLDQPDAGSWVVFGEGGRTAYTAQFDGLLHAWDLTGTQGILRRSVGGSDDPGLARVSPDGRRVLHVSTAPDPVLTIVDSASGAVQHEVAVGQDATNYVDGAWSPDGRLVSVTTGDDAVGVWDSATGDRLATRDLPVDEIASYGAFTADGRLLVGTTTGRMHVLDARTLEPEREALDVAALVGGEGALSSLIPRPRSDQVLTAVDGRGTWLVDVDRGTADRLDIGHEVFGAAYSPDGSRLAVTTREGEVGLYAVDTGRWIAAPTARHPFAGWSASFNGDGTEVAVAASGRLGRWDGRTGAFLGAVTVGDDGVAGYGPGASSLLLAGGSGRTSTWALDEQGWVAAACRMAGRSLTAGEWRTYLPDREPQEVC
ncbi:WD40 repeat domain-containing protein, partial [Knoellia aerolata]